MAEPEMRPPGRPAHEGREAGEARRATRFHSLTAALLRAVSAEQVAAVVLEEGCRALDAAFGALYRVSPDAGRLVLTRSTGVFDSLSGELVEIDVRAGHPFAEVLRSGRPICMESRAALAARYPALLGAAERMGVEGWVVFPLGAGDHLQGAVSFGFRSPHPCGAADRGFLAALAEQCALALERARLYEAERLARRASERLQALTAALSEAATPAEVGEVMMRDGVAALGAYAGVIALEVPGDAELEILASVGYPAEACMAAGRRWTIEAPIPIAEATRTGEPVFLGSPEAWARHFRTYVPAPGSSAAWAAIPLRLRADARGALLWTFDAPQDFSPTDRELMLAIARQGAQALERAWLFDAERRARAQAERAVRRISRLQELTAALAGALTPEQVARAVVEHGTAALGADGGVVVLATPDRSALAVVDSVGFPEPIVERWARFPTSCDVPLAEAFRTGEPIVLLTPEERRSRYPALAESLTDHASSASVPLLVDGEAVGAMGLVFRDPIHLQAGDREFLLALGRLCAQAVRRASLYAQVEEANRAKADFLATMSHELRTPLTAVIGYEELLAEGITGPVTEAQRGQLQRIKASAMHLLSLIDEVLTFARVEAGTERMLRGPVEVTQAIERAAELIAPLAGERGLALEVRPPDAPVSIETDAGKLQQVLVNLLSNAVKFTERGTVRLSAAAENGRVIFEVTDSGIGIAEEDLERIFEPFTQVEAAATRRFGGTGLGLSVCRKLVDLMGGDLSVRSVPGEGSTFSVSLPR